MLEKLRAKPEHVKRNIALGATIVIFTGIVFVWWTSFEARIHKREAQEKALSPVESFKQLFNGITSSMKNSIADTPAYVNTANIASSSSATSTSKIFDISEVVVVDTASTTR